MSSSTNTAQVTAGQVTAVVEHPAWCDRSRCTATATVAPGEAHRGTRVTVNLYGIYGTLEITAFLSQSHCRWPTDVYVDFDVHGLRQGYQITGGTAAFTVDKLAAIGQLVMDLARLSGGGGSETSPGRQRRRESEPGRVATLVPVAGVAGDDRFGVTHRPHHIRRGHQARGTTRCSGL